MLCTIDSLSFKKPCGFLVIDGVNGAGKTTLQRTIVEYLNAQGLSALATREPGDSELGIKIRSLVLEKRETTLSERSELFLFSADRVEHVEKTIKPALLQGKLVISDRYFYSTTAFQGYGRGLDLDVISRVNNFAIAGTLPDFVILTDLEPSIGLQRAGKRSQGQDLFESESLAFQTRMRQGFITIAKQAKEPFIIIDASKSQDDMFAASRPALDAWVTSLKNTRQ